MLSFVWITNRPDCRFRWYAESLGRQLEQAKIEKPQVIVVDLQLWKDAPEKRKIDIATQAENLLPYLSEFTHVPPKPCAVQGPNRKTPEDWFAAANARNTGICLSRGSYIVFCDDVSVLLSGWLDNVLHAAENGYVVAGAYKKVKNLVVEKGEIVSFEEFPGGVDSRWGIGDSGGIVKLSGNALFGCSFGAGTQALLDINGFDQIADSCGLEDADIGSRLEKNGNEIWYNRNMLTYESEELHSQPGGEHLPRRDWVTEHDNGVHLDWLIANRISNTDTRVATGNEYNISDVRNRVLNGGSFPLPQWESPPWNSKIKYSDMTI